MIHRKTTAAWAFLLLLGLIAAACEQGPFTPALLPPGTASAPVPEVEVDAYLYIHQGQPTTLVRGLANLPLDVEVVQTSFWLGRRESGEFSGAVFDFTSAAMARAVYNTVPLDPDQWKHLDGARLTLVRGSEDATLPIREAIEAGQWKELSQLYPDVWDRLNRALPSQPPSPPRAVGFFRVADWLNWATDKTGNAELKKAAPLVSSGGLKAGVLAAYSQTPLVPPLQADPGFLKQSGVSALVVAQSSYPGFIFSFILDNIVLRSAPLKEVPLNGASAQRLDVPDAEAVILLKNRGNLLYLSIAAEEGPAKALLLTALAK